MLYRSSCLKFVNVLAMVFYAIITSPVVAENKTVQGDERAQLNIYAVHYAPRGYCRMGSTGYGEFLDLSFGRTNCCDDVAVDKLEGTNHVLCVQKKISTSKRGFDNASLYYDNISRKLFKVVVMREYAQGTDWEIIANALKGFSADCDHWFAIRVPVPSCADYIKSTRKLACDDGKFCRSIGEDGSFSICFDVYRRTDGFVNVEISVESIRVRLVRSPKNKHADSEVEVEGL